MAEERFIPRVFPGGEAHEILPRVFLGSMEAASDKESLAANGVTHILTVNGKTPVFPDAFIYRVVNMGGKRGGITQHLDQCLPFVREGAQPGKGVLIHCTHGTGRSAAMAIAYVMDHGPGAATAAPGEGTAVGFPEAFRLVKARRPGTDPPLSYQKELGEWEKTQDGGK